MVCYFFWRSQKISKEIHGLMDGITSLSPLQVIEVNANQPFSCPSLHKMEDFGPEKRKQLATSLYYNYMVINRFTKSYWIFTKFYWIFLPNHTGFLPNHTGFLPNWKIYQIILDFYQTKIFYQIILDFYQIILDFYQIILDFYQIILNFFTNFFF